MELGPEGWRRRDVWRRDAVDVTNARASEVSRRCQWKDQDAVRLGFHSADRAFHRVLQREVPFGTDCRQRLRSCGAASPVIERPRVGTRKVEGRKRGEIKQVALHAGFAELQSARADRE